MPATILSADSGLGGLSVVVETRRIVAGARHIYVCDNAYYPYGLREEVDLLAHFLRVMDHAIAMHSPDIVVVACNTISTICLPGLRAMTTVPVVGVVPAVKPASAMSRRRVIGILATPATIYRPYTDRLVEEFAGDCRVIRLGSAELVDMAEAKLRGVAPRIRAITRILAPFFDRPEAERPDVIVLACTHFPLLREELAASAPPDVRWIDSGAAIARRVSDLLLEAPPSGTPAASDLAIVTGTVDLALRRALAGFGFSAIERLPRT